MKRIAILIHLLIAFTLSATAQTKRIAHRSHAGSLIAYADFETDNLGLPYEMERFYDSSFKAKNLIKDSVSLIKADSLKKAKPAKPVKSGKNTKKLKIDSIKITPKVEPLPPNKPSEEGKRENETLKKSNLGLLLLIALPVSFIAVITGKRNA